MIEELENNEILKLLSIYLCIGVESEQEKCQVVNEDLLIFILLIFILWKFSFWSSHVSQTKPHTRRLSSVWELNVHIS